MTQLAADRTCPYCGRPLSDFKWGKMLLTCPEHQYLHVRDYHRAYYHRVLRPKHDPRLTWRQERAGVAA